jgi:hypothetical protein
VNGGRIEQLARAYLEFVARELSSTLASVVSGRVYRRQEWRRVDADNWRLTSWLTATPAAVMFEHWDHVRSSPEQCELAEALRDDRVVSAMVGNHLGPLGFGSFTVESIEAVTDRLVEQLIQAIVFDESGSFSIPSESISIAYQAWRAEAWATTDRVVFLAPLFGVAVQQDVAISTHATISEIPDDEIATLLALGYLLLDNDHRVSAQCVRNSCGARGDARGVRIG